MNRKTLFMGVSLAILCLALVHPASAKFVYSFSSTQCNKFETEATSKTLDKTYTAWTVSITNNLDYGHSNDSLKFDIYKAGSTDKIALTFMVSEYLLSVWMSESGTSFIVYNGTNIWERNKPITLSVIGSYLQVAQSNGTVVVKDYAVGQYSIDKVAVWMTTGSYFSGGYVTVEVNDAWATAFTYQIVDLIVPLMVLAITLGILQKVLRSMSKHT